MIQLQYYSMDIKRNTNLVRTVVDQRNQSNTVGHNNYLSFWQLLLTYAPAYKGMLLNYSCPFPALVKNSTIFSSNTS